MRYAMIDNSTLTAVQRLLGEIKVKNKATIDMDILCFENYIESILFYDEIIAIDDYKEEFRNSRKEYFNDIKFIPKTEFDYDFFINKSLEKTTDISPKIEGGFITDDNFKEFFKLLRMNMVFTWDMTSSVFYLTQKMLQHESGLDIEKYSILNYAIFTDYFSSGELSKTLRKIDYELIDSKGHNIELGRYKVNNTTAEIKQQTKIFLSGLNWLAQRTTFYSYVSNYFQADTFMHPIRQSFNINLINKHINTPTGKLKPLIDAMNEHTTNALNQIISFSQPFVSKHKIPLFCTYLIHKTENPFNVIKEAYGLRNKDSFKQARDKLNKIDELVEELEHEKYIKEGNKLLLETENLMNRMLIDYGIKTKQGISTSMMISFWNIASLLFNTPKLPKIDIKIKNLDFLNNIGPKRGFKGIYRNIIQDLVSIERLGQYHDLLTKDVDLDSDAKFYYAKTEDPKFLKAKSYWKIPM